jgi:hypothetical protein
MRNRLPRAVAAIELLLAVGCLLGAWACWAAGVRSTSFPPGGGMPGFTSRYYSGGWIFGASLLVIVAAVVLIDAARRLRASARIPSGGIVEA